MKKVFAVGNVMLKAEVERMGFRCELISADIPSLKDALIIRIRRQSDYRFFEPLKK